MRCPVDAALSSTKKAVIESVIEQGQEKLNVPGVVGEKPLQLTPQLATGVAMLKLYAWGVINNLGWQKS